MGLYVMHFQVAGIGSVPLVMAPLALHTSMLVTNQDVSSDGVGNLPVVDGGLPVLFKKINPYGKIGASRGFCNYRPTELSPQLTGSPGPLGPIVRYVT